MQKTNKQIRESFSDRLSLIGSKEEKNFIMENLSLMLGAGLSISASFESIAKGLKNKALKRIVQKMIVDINEGSNLHGALSKTNLLPPYALSLIRIGEESGRLTQNLQAIALQQQKDEALNSKLHSAMIYPVLVLSITVVVGLGVAWFILPKLAKVFTNLKLTLPLITRVLIFVSNILSQHGYWLLPVMVLSFILFIYLVFYNRRTNRSGQWLLFFLPMTRRLIVNLELSRMGFVFSSLLTAGVPIRETVRLLSESTQVYRYQRFYKYLGEGFEVGNSFQTSFSKYPKIDQIIPLPIQQVIVSGEQSGRLGESLVLIANRFEQKTEESIKNLPIVLEPVFLVIIWLGVLVVALAVILPIYSLVGSLNNS